MADATVTHTVRDETRVHREELPAAVADALPRAAPTAQRLIIGIWAAFVAAMLAFLAFGSVRVGAGNWIGLRLDVRRIWSRFVDYLVDEGASGAIVFGVTVAAALSLAGAAYVLWLAFALKDASGDQSPGDAAQR